jgi:hypothetical protein
MGNGREDGGDDVGEVDGYYSLNFDQPSAISSPIAPRCAVGNELRAFDNNANQFSPNAAELVLDKAPDTTSAESRAGYHVGVIYGQAAEAINGNFNLNNITRPTPRTSPSRGLTSTISPRSAKG